MKSLRLLLALLLPCASVALAQGPVSAPAARDLAGTWFVTATAGKDSTCTGVQPGTIDANVWLVSVGGDGSLEVVVQGNTAFPQLIGSLQADSPAVVLQATTLMTAAWFRLAPVDARTLVGVKRVVSRSGNGGGASPCFVDYALEARKQ